MELIEGYSLFFIDNEKKDNAGCLSHGNPAGKVVGGKNRHFLAFSTLRACYNQQGCIFLQVIST